MGASEIAENPIAWQQAAEWTTANTFESISNLLRSREQLDTYLLHLEKLRSKYNSTADYLKISIFGADQHPGPDGKICAGDLPQVPDGQPIIKLLLNEFPYYFEQGIQHYVLWATQPLPAEEIQKNIQQNFGGLETLCWINPAPLQSVTSIWHCHILTRAKAV